MKKNYLFSYGTLQLPQIQQSLFGRKLRGKPDKLVGYTLGELKVEAHEEDYLNYYPIAIPSKNTEDQIEGVIYEVSEAELEEIDVYEGNEYIRVMENFDSGQKAWVYIKS